MVYIQDGATIGLVGILDVEKEINATRKRLEERASCLSRTLGSVWYGFDLFEKQSSVSWTMVEC